MPFASTVALPGLDFERERVPPGAPEIARFPHGPQSFGADEKPFATSAQLRQVVPTRYRIRRSFLGPKHSPQGARDRAREPALHDQKRFVRWPNLRLLGKQLRESCTPCPAHCHSAGENRSRLSQLWPQSRNSRGSLAPRHREEPFVD